MNRTFLLLLCAAVFGVAFATSRYGHYRKSGYRGYPVRVRAVWGSWGKWTSCDKQCGGGYQTRTRECQKPKYRVYGKVKCIGSDVEKKKCNTQYCKVDGVWSDWGDYSKCSVHCGGGLKTRYRTCTNPSPAYGGAKCYGSESHTISCNTHHCKVDGKWSEWGDYSKCSASCGGGYQVRTRTCSSPAPAYNGEKCYGDESEKIKCNDYHCSVDGKWSEWGDYSKCSKHCGGGYKLRTRTCSSPAPAYGGKKCSGNESHREECNTHHCKVNGGWSNWGDYSKCSASCGDGYQVRTRTCTHPAPSYGGEKCYGYDNEKQKCNNGYCPVHGGWSKWSKWSACSGYCGSGYRNRSRSCSYPAPAYGGNKCYGEKTEKEVCHHVRKCYSKKY